MLGNEGRIMAFESDGGIAVDPVGLFCPPQRQLLRIAQVQNDETIR